MLSAVLLRMDQYTRYFEVYTWYTVPVFFFFLLLHFVVVFAAVCFDLLLVVVVDTMRSHCHDGIMRDSPWRVIDSPR